MDKCKDCGQDFDTNAGYIRCDVCSENICVKCVQVGLLCKECKEKKDETPDS